MTMQYFEIPLSPGKPTDFSVTLSGVPYQMSLRWRDNDQAGWVLDIFDINAQDLVCGIPLVTGLDLLMQYKYLGIQGSLVVLTDGDTWAAPTFDNLGTASHLYFVVGP